MSVDFSRYSFNAGEKTGPLADLGLLPKMDQVRLIEAGINVQDHHVSGAFMQINKDGVHCNTRHEGVELLSIQAALINTMDYLNITGICLIQKKTSWPEP